MLRCWPSGPRPEGRGYLNGARSGGAISRAVRRQRFFALLLREQATGGVEHVLAVFGRLHFSLCVLDQAVNIALLDRRKFRREFIDNIANFIGFLGHEIPVAREVVFGI